MSLVPWSEVDDSSMTSTPGAERAEDFAPLKPGNHEGFVWSRDVEALTVHLFMRQLNAFANAFENGMRGIEVPKDFCFACFTPAE